MYKKKAPVFRTCPRSHTRLCCLRLPTLTANRELQQHLSVCVAVVRKLVGNMDALGEDYGELGRALSHFARLEEGLAARQGHYTTGGASSVQLGADLQRLGYGALRQHSLSKQVGWQLVDLGVHACPAQDELQGDCGNCCLLVCTVAAAL